MELKRTEHRLSEATAINLYYSIMSLKNAVQYLQAISDDVDVPGSFNYKCLRPILNKVKASIQHIYFFIPEHRYKELYDDVIKLDSVKFDSIRDYLSRMTPDQQDMVEEFCEGVVKGTIHEYVEDKT